LIDKFYNTHGSFYGKFRNFHEATSFLKQTSSKKDYNIGYNNKVSALRVYQRCKEISKNTSPTEYPLFLWLNKILQTEKELSILDVGGAFGLHYYNFIKYALHYKFHWTIYDVESIVDYANMNGYKTEQLNFINNYREIDKIDILIASGSIQYIEEFSINDFKNKPRHLLFERLPLNEKCETFVTLQNATSSFNPQYVYNKNEFISTIKNIGYELVEEWKNYYDSCRIPEYPNESCYTYTGLYFRAIV